MTNRSARQERPIEPDTNPFTLPAAVLGIWGPAFAGGAACNTKTHENVALMSAEWQDFVSLRLKEDMSLVQRMASSRSPAQLLGAYMELWGTAVADYCEESGRIGKLAGDFMQSSATAVQRGMNEAPGTEEGMPVARAA